MYDFTILVLAGAFPSSVALSVDILSTATLMADRCGVPAPRWRICGFEKQVRLQNGLSIAADILPSEDEENDGSIWVIPALGLSSPQEVNTRLADADAVSAIKAVQHHVNLGGKVAASCSGVFLLQAAQLLRGKRVTTAWWLAGFLRGIEPQCQVDTRSVVVADGAITTAGAASAQADLMLHLLRKRISPSLADAVSNVMLIDQRRAQSPMILPAMLNGGHDFISQLVKRLELALPSLPSVKELAAQLCMSERTLARHVQATMGCSTSTLLQHIRLNKARQLLQTSSLSVEQVAAKVGYVDSTALRRLMRKTIGVTPMQLRSASIPYI